MTTPDSWHSETEFDLWIWRTKFSADGVAAYGNFIKKKSVFVSRHLLPYIKRILGSTESMEKRYFNGNQSMEAVDIYNIINEEEGTDTRGLRIKAGLKDREKKGNFENELLELQGSMDIVISGIQEKIYGKKGWSSTAFETYDSWAMRNRIESLNT